MNFLLFLFICSDIFTFANKEKKICAVLHSFEPTSHMEKGFFNFDKERGRNKICPVDFGLRLNPNKNHPQLTLCVKNPVESRAECRYIPPAQNNRKLFKNTTKKKSERRNVTAVNRRIAYRSCGRSIVLRCANSRLSRSRRAALRRAAPLLLWLWLCIASFRIS